MGLLLAFEGIRSVTSDLLLFVIGSPLALVGIVLIRSAYGALRGSRDWWLVGMGYYTVAGILSVTEGAPVGVALFVGILLLGSSGWTTLS